VSNVRTRVEKLEGQAARRLAAAVVLRACRDARLGNGYAAEARDWLAGDGADLAEQLDLDAGRVIRWVDGLPGLVQEGLPGL